MSTRPSPFAAALLFSYIANYIYEGDAPLAERRAQALSIDQSQLEELLGDVDLRELLDPPRWRKWKPACNRWTPSIARATPMACTIFCSSWAI